MKKINQTLIAMYSCRIWSIGLLCILQTGAYANDSGQNLIFAVDGGNLYFETGSTLLSAGDTVRIVWEIDGLAIDIGTARVDRVDGPTGIAAVTDGNPAIGMRIERLPDEAPQDPAPAESQETELVVSIEPGPDPVPQVELQLPSTPQLQPQPEPKPLPEPAQTPAPAAYPDLSLCEDHLAANRLTVGEGGNAYDCYRAVLAASPYHEGAIAGLRAIERRYEGLIDTALRDGDPDRAETFVSRLQSVNPESAEIMPARLRIAVMRQNEQQLQASQTEMPQPAQQQIPIAKPAPSQGPPPTVLQQAQAPEPEQGPSPDNSPSVFAPSVSVVTITENSKEAIPAQPDPVPPSTQPVQINRPTESNEPAIQVAAISVEEWSEQSVLDKTRAMTRFTRAYAMEKQLIPGSGEEVLRLYRRSAERGYAPAQYRLGWALENGLFGEADPSEALAWYLRAADGGNEQARLGVNRLQR